MGLKKKKKRAGARLGAPPPSADSPVGGCNVSASGLID